MTSAYAQPPDTAAITIRRGSGTIVVRPAPRREPPFDDELDQSTPTIGRYDQPLPFERPTRRRDLQPLSSAAIRAALPDPAHWGRRLLVAVIETAAGRRPLNQLTSLVSPSVAYGLRTDFERSAQRGRPHWTHAATVRSLRSSEPTENVAELSATVRAGERVHAVAMRLEARQGRWCCTRLILG